MRPRGIVTKNFSISNLKIALQESRFKGKISLGKEVYMNELKVYYFEGCT